MKTPSTDSTLRDFYIPMAILAALFGIIGLLSWMNAMLIPYFKVACELNHTQSYFVALAFYIAYLVMSAPASKLLDFVGYKRGIVLGLWFMALGALIFIPAAYTRQYWIFLSGLFTIGTGLAILQTAVNPYVTIIGPIDSASRRISVMGLCNKTAGILAPLIFAAVILKSSDTELFAQLNQNLLSGEEKISALNELIQRVISPYAGLSIALFLFGIFVGFSPLPEIKNESSQSDSSSEESKRSIFSYPYLVLGALAIFFHVASQIIAVDTIISYANTMGFDLNSAKIFPSITLTCTLLGYIMGIILIPRFFSQKTMFQFCVILGMIISICVVCFTFEIQALGKITDTSIWFLCLLGFPNALIYAGIWPLAIRDLGEHTNRGASLLVMALCGNAIMPVIYGVIADKTSLHFGYIVLIPCFLYLIFYAFYGYKIERWSKVK